MKILLDQGVPRSAAELLRDAGVDAVHTGEIRMARAADEAILTRAREESRLVVTLDADFHALLATSGASRPSVIRLRLEGLRAERTRDVVLRVLQSCRADLEAGAVASVEPDRVRIRRLPLIRRPEA